MDKFYPIGTICKLDNSSKYVMITGYLTNTYENGLSTYDYEGYVYPYGTFFNNKVLFNEESIQEVIFTGYIDQSYRHFVDSCGNNHSTNLESIHNDGEMVLVQNNTYDKLLFDNEGNVLIADEVSVVDEELEDISTKTETTYKFNDEGVLVSETQESVEEETLEFEESKVETTYEFNDEGVLVSETQESAEEETLEFEESKVETTYKFNDEGVLVSEIQESVEEEIPAIGPGLPGYEESKIPAIGPGLPGYEESKIPAIGPGLPGYEEK